ncbi:hypothetical protein SOV_38670 [Sporomusa ovata DSM 2662]|uniref:Core component Dace_2067 of predicted ECF transporter n=1 Tax=Sporomusa ovata TaxID=2378 RepID=A0A0U1KSE5_9FIRM|nr:hypothetical protein [Sporomusa ovata]EQB26255.1 hypothetical protein SOV_3c01290 [Sporomusa ovata DSM 2662]CQR70332.1 Core component Dace_2067 of predicted ECF transporter [Sporomusa ovata]
MENVNAKNLSLIDQYIFKLSLADILRSTMFGTIIVLIKDITRLPLSLPGHSSIFWMGVLVLGKGLLPKFGSGIIMGIVSGILAVFLGLGKEGFFVFFKYFMPGLLIDFLAPMFYNKLDRPIVGIICGILTSLSKMAVNVALGIFLKLPLVFLTIGLGFTSVSHVVFGAAGGLIATIMIKRLKSRLSSWD